MENLDEDYLDEEFMENCSLDRPDNVDGECNIDWGNDPDDSSSSGDNDDDEIKDEFRMAWE